MVVDSDYQVLPDLGKKLVEKKVKELVRNDRARTQVSRISQFGLLEMSRQRLRQSFIEWKTELSHHSSALKSIYLIKEKLNNKKCKSLIVNINPFMKKYLVDNFQSEINNIENETNVTISFFDDISISNSEISIGEQTKETNKNDRKPKKKIAKKRVSTVKKRSSMVKKTKIKVRDSEHQVPSPIKEIKDKKSGWWQK